ncbi:MAG: hypothetical protein HOW73_15745 [Polyangiaceae bacterium]|nr:hypothetical protein [Polyangiaceae bacterium]
MKLRRFHAAVCSVGLLACACGASPAVETSTGAREIPITVQVRGRPAPTAEPRTGADWRCTTVSPVVQADLEREMRKRHHPHTETTKLVVTWACPKSPVNEVVYQRIDNGGLRILRLRRVAAGFEALRLAIDEYGSQSKLAVQRAVLRLEQGQRIANTSAALVDVRLSEVDDGPPAIGFGTTGIGGFWHVALGVRDDAGSARGRETSGEQTSLRQLEQIPLALARAEVERAVESADWLIVPVDDEIRAFVLDRFRASKPLDVKNLALYGFAVLLRDTAPPAALPILADALVRVVQADKVDPGSTEAVLLAAVRRISGIDLEKDPRPLREAIREFARNNGVK